LGADENETVERVQEHLLPVTLFLRQSASAGLVAKSGQLSRNLSSGGRLRRLDQFLVSQKLHSVETGLQVAWSRRFLIQGDCQRFDKLIHNPASARTSLPLQGIQNWFWQFDGQQRHDISPKMTASTYYCAVNQQSSYGDRFAGEPTAIAS
jgi:hypothetical protein